MTPYLESSLEIARRLSSSNNLSYVHLGRYVSRPTMYSSNIFKRSFQLPIRVKRAKKYLSKYSSIGNSIEWLEVNRINNEMQKVYKSLPRDENFGKFNNLEELKSFK